MEQETENYHPGVVLAKVMQEKNVTPEELSRLSGESSVDINSILEGTYEFTLETTGRFQILRSLYCALDINFEQAVLKGFIENPSPDPQNQAFIEKYILPTLKSLNEVRFGNDNSVETEAN